MICLVFTSLICFILTDVICFVLSPLIHWYWLLSPLKCLVWATQEGGGCDFSLFGNNLCNNLALTHLICLIYDPLISFYLLVHSICLVLATVFWLVLTHKPLNLVYVPFHMFGLCSIIFWLVLAPLYIFGIDPCFMFVIGSYNLFDIGLSLFSLTCIDYLLRGGSWLTWKIGSKLRNHMSRGMRFPTMWHSDKCRLRRACVASL